MVDRCMDGEMEWDDGPRHQSTVLQGYNIKVFRADGTEDTGYSWPHCDCRVLHAPDECEYCADAKELQEERERLDVSNTGKMNRRWVCPADRDRPLTNQEWRGNKPLKEAP